jgi:hypothetical protein
MRRTATWGVVLLALAAGCGADEKKAESPAEAEAEAADEGGAASDDGLVPEEKFDQIRSTFERKSAMVGRCHAPRPGADGERAPRGEVTVGVTIGTDGKASAVKIQKTTLGAEASECIKKLVEGWEFTDSLPRAIDTSHTYKLDTL